MEQTSSSFSKSKNSNAAVASSAPPFRLADRHVYLAETRVRLSGLVLLGIMAAQREFSRFAARGHRSTEFFYYF
jgi:hypothetical protein